MKAQLLLATFLAAPAFAQQANVKQQVQLPRNPRAWVNSSPVSMEALKGKGVVLYFYEEG